MALLRLLTWAQLDFLRFSHSHSAGSHHVHSHGLRMTEQKQRDASIGGFPGPKEITCSTMLFPFRSGRRSLGEWLYLSFDWSKCHRFTLRFPLRPDAV